MAIYAGQRPDFGIRPRGFEEHARFLRHLSENIGAHSAAVSEVGRIAIQRIRERTEAGVDMHDRPFRRYSSVYEQMKRNRGQPGRVNMRLSGDMLDGMIFKSFTSRTGTKIVIYFKPEVSVRAYVHHSGALSGRRNQRFMMPQRKFFGLRAADEVVLTTYMKEQLEKFLYREATSGAYSIRKK